MPRKKTPAPAPISTPALPVEVIHADQNLMAKQEAELIEQWGEGLPYVREHYMAEIRRDMARTVESVLAIGRRLIVMKAMEPHGTWIECLGSIGIGEDNAQRMMAAARRIAGLPNTATSRHLLEAVGNPSKLFDLLALPDEQLVEIAAGGEAGGIDLDDVTTMTVRELRAALREARADIAAKDDVIGGKEQQIERLHKDLRKVKKVRDEATPDEEADQLRQKVGQVALSMRSLIQADGEVASLRTRIRELIEHGDAHGQSHEVFLAGAFAELARDLAALRDEFGLPATVDADERPAWARETEG